MCSIDSCNCGTLNAVKRVVERGRVLESPDLDRRSFSFVLPAGEELKSGDIVVVREVKDRGNGECEIIAVAEKAILQETEKIFAT